MPYIQQKDRTKYDQILNQINLIETKGDLEYCLYKLMLKYMSTRERRYSQLHDCVYAAAHCSDEFRRRFLDKREDDAVMTNGDVV